MVCVAIGGSSCSGKTTIVHALAECFRLNLTHPTILHQDAYFKNMCDIEVDSTTGFQDWDSLAALDMDRFESDIVHAKSSGAPSFLSEENTSTKFFASPSPGAIEAGRKMLQPLLQHLTSDFVLVEGFLLFSNDQVSSLFDVKICLHVTLDELKRRRQGRMYPLNAMDDAADPPNYIERIVYPNFLNNHRHVLSDPKGSHNVHLIDSTSSTLDEILVQIVEILSLHLRNRIAT